MVVKALLTHFIIYVGLPKDGDCFQYLYRKFPHLSETKLREKVFVGSDIRKMMFGSSFEASMSTKRKETSINQKL